MTKARIYIFLVTIIIVSLGGYIGSLYARGYKLNTKTMRFTPSGLMVTKSEPDGAQIFVNGELKGATNSNLSFAPGTYDVAVKKEAYRTWSKRITIEKEVVTEINANLFLIAPSLSAVTFSGCINPVSSPDFTKIVYAVPATTENLNTDKEGLWIMEMSNLPLGFSRDPRRITDGDMAGASWEFSPDGRQILLTTVGGRFILETGGFTSQSQRTNIQNKLADTQKQWNIEAENKFNSQTRGLPTQLIEILKNKTSKVLFSPDETRILYITTKDAELPTDLIKQIPGSSTQIQERSLKPGRAYIYDIKEDRNFFLAEVSNADLENCALSSNTARISCSATLSWLPTSRHILLAQSDKIIIMDYDGTNRQEVYSGSYVAPFAFSLVSSDRILILTNLGANSSVANLYSLSLK